MADLGSVRDFLRLSLHAAANYKQRHFIDFNHTSNGGFSCAKQTLKIATNEIVGDNKTPASSKTAGLPVFHSHKINMIKEGAWDHGIQYPNALAPW
jgi:hypothetical protein